MNQQTVLEPQPSRSLRAAPSEDVVVQSAAGEALGQAWLQPRLAGAAACPLQNKQSSSTD